MRGNKDKVYFSTLTADKTGQRGDGRAYKWANDVVYLYASKAMIGGETRPTEL